MLVFLGYSDGSEHLHRTIRQWKMDFILFQKADISLELGFCTCYDDLELQPLLSAAISLNSQKEKKKEI